MNKSFAIVCSLVSLGSVLLLTTFGQAQNTVNRTPAKVVPTYYKDIAPILKQNCVSCHVAGGIAPFALDNPRNAVAYSTRIVQVTQSGYMPPWLPSADSEAYLNERKLSAASKKVLADWANAKTPLGIPLKK
mgnify:CR=1 FL=1